MAVEAMVGLLRGYTKGLWRKLFNKNYDLIYTYIFQ